MGNPGLKKHTALPSLTTPKGPNTNNVVPPEPVTTQENVMTAPGPTGVHTSPPVDATNGAPPILDYQPISATQAQPDPNKPANQRRIEQQKQPGGGAKENPAYERAQNDVQEKMQRRRMSALYPRQAETDEEFWARQPDMGHTDTDGYVSERSTDIADIPYGYGYGAPQSPSEPGCETCYLRGNGTITPKHHWLAGNDHEFTPFEVPSNARFSSDLHDHFDMMPFEHDLGNQEDPFYNPMSHQIHHVDPRSPQYDTDYERGWQQAQKYVGDDGEGQSPLEDMDDANVSHAAYDGYADFAVGHPRRKWHMRAVRRLGIPDGQWDDLPGQPNPMTDEQWEHPEKVASFQRVAADILHQGQSHETDEEWWARQPDVVDFTPDDDEAEERHPGATHSFEPGCETCYLQGSGATAPEFHAGRGHPFKPLVMGPNERYSSANALHPVKLALLKQAETDDEWWDRQPDMQEYWTGGPRNIMEGKPTCEFCYLHGYQSPDWMDGEEAHNEVVDRWDDIPRHDYKPMTMGKNERFSSAKQVVAVVRTAETDEEFWERMEREYPGQQPKTEPYTSLSPDEFRHEEPVAREPWQNPDHGHPDLDPDEEIPENMSSREHATLRNAPGFQYNDNPRWPQYTSNATREIRDANGRQAWANEGHVIEHNLNHHGPVLPSDDDPNPHPLGYQWMHTFYPAGLSDDEGLYRGYNTAEAALAAANKIRVWGPRYPQSHELLKNYIRVGDDAPYDSRMKFPHEFESGHGPARLRTASFDEERGEWLYNIDRPNYWHTDRPPSSVGSSNQGDPEDGKGFFSERRIPYEEGEPQPVEDAEGFLTSDPKLDDSFWHHPGHQVCETCKAMGLDPSRSPERHKTIPGYHPYKPMPDTAPGERLAAFDPARGEFIYDIDDKDYPFGDKPPSALVGDLSRGEMFKFKDTPYMDWFPEDDSHSSNYTIETPMRHRGYPGCQTCLDKGFLPPYERENTVHDTKREPSAHEYNPMVETKPGERLARVNPGLRRLAKTA